VYYKETVECRLIIFWPGSQRTVHCHTAELEPNLRVSIDRVSLLVKFTAGRTAAGFSPWTAEFNSRLVHAGYAVDKVGQGGIIVKYFGFPLPIIILQVLHTHLSPVSMG
jgi:hypothetical protein